MNFVDEFTISSPLLGEVTLSPVNPKTDGPAIHSWVTKSYASFWGMMDQTEQQVVDFYQKLNDSEHQSAYLATVNNEPLFLIEVYDPKAEPVGQCFAVEKGDVGMHILLSPPDRPMKGFSEAAMRTVMGFMFTAVGAKRVVVEPDAQNQKIHRLNVLVGFEHVREIYIPMGQSSKHALLGFCTPAKFAQSELVAHYLAGSTQQDEQQTRQPSLATQQLNNLVWSRANRHLVKKALTEFSHERLFHPVSLGDGAYQLFSDSQEVSYRFNANVMSLHHLQIDAESIVRFVKGKRADLDAIEFIIEFKQQLGLEGALLGTYLEEISSTLLSACYKYNRPTKAASELVHCDFQTIETQMSEGHPVFIANNGRIGFNTKDYHAHAPEVARPTQLIWLAAHKSKTAFHAIQNQDYESLIESELDISLRLEFRRTLASFDLNPNDYLLFPVHPWQWFNKLSHLYAADIAKQQLVCLGYGNDYYLAQQSIRTMFNLSRPNKSYVKVALSILNMGFMRGLSAKYMAVTPAINEWLHDLVIKDDVLESYGFTPLREFATLGFEATHYDREELGDNPYKKMLAALWRENPVNMIEPDQSLMTMAALLHIDNDGNSVAVEAIKASGVSPDQWLRSYFNAYLMPLIHCFYEYKLVFMPHGENLILVMEDHIPVSVFMKDIGEEICLLNQSRNLPNGVERIAIDMPEQMEILSIFTDVFDCIFRYLVDLLDAQLGYPEKRFWAVAAEQIQQYQAQHPNHASLFEKYDLFMDEFGHSCLNRLQLGNNKQMVDLTDPANSLQFAGTLVNPIAQFKEPESVARILTDEFVLSDQTRAQQVA